MTNRDAATTTERGFVSGTCRGVTCHMCGKHPAVVKVGEEIAYDDPNPNRHNATAYLCESCEGIVLGGAWLRAGVTTTERLQAERLAKWLDDWREAFVRKVHPLDRAAATRNFEIIAERLRAGAGGGDTGQRIEGWASDLGNWFEFSSEDGVLGTHAVRATLIIHAPPSTPQDENK